MPHWYRIDGSGAENVALHVSCFPEVGATPCGVWLNVYGDRKWVSTSARKRFAYPTREEAVTSFLARKRRQIKLLTWQIESAKRQLALCEKTPPLQTDYVHEEFATFLDLDEGPC